MVVMVGVDQVERGFSLAAGAGAGGVGADGADVAPVADEFGVAVLVVDEHGGGVAGVDDETVGGGEVTFGLGVEAVDARVGEYLAGRVVSIEFDELVFGGFEDGSLAFA